MKKLIFLFVFIMFCAHAKAQIYVSPGGGGGDLATTLAAGNTASDTAIVDSLLASSVYVSSTVVASGTGGMPAQMLSLDAGGTPVAAISVVSEANESVGSLVAIGNNQYRSTLTLGDKGYTGFISALDSGGADLFKVDSTNANFVFASSTTASTRIVHRNTNNASTGPSFVFQHDPASSGGTIGSSDIVGELIWESGAGPLEVGNIYVQYTDPTGSSEDTTMHFETKTGGATFNAMDLIGGATPTVQVGAGFVIATTGGQPACDSSTRGMIWYTASGAGVSDALEVCIKNAADSYEWKGLF